MQTSQQSDSVLVEELTEALAAPFDPREVRFKPAVVSGRAERLPPYHLAPAPPTGLRRPDRPRPRRHARRGPLKRRSKRTA